MKNQPYSHFQSRFFTLFMMLCLLGVSMVPIPALAQQINPNIVNPDRALKPMVSLDNTLENSVSSIGSALVSQSTVSGVVTNSVTGAPLAAEIDIPEYSGSPIFTNPTTGAYSVILDYGTDYHFSVVSDGYITGTATVNPATPTVTQDFPLSLNIATCSAPGYAWKPGFLETFDSLTFPPSGWSADDTANPGVIWKLSSSIGTGEPNYTGGTGTTAEASSQALGQHAFDTTLTSPSIPIAGLPGQYLTYKANYAHLGTNEALDLDIQVDGDASWTNILNWQEDHGLNGEVGGEAVAVDLSSYLSGHTSFMVRWRYYDSNPTAWDFYAQIDDVSVGDCIPAQTAIFKSVGNYDGWVLESTEPSNQGGTLDKSSTLLYVGDDASDRQYKSFVSFNTTSLLDSADIRRVQLKFKIQGFAGGNMFTTKTLNNLVMDIKKSHFGSSTSLVVGDFQAKANGNGVGILSSASTGWRTVTLTATSFSFINRNGTTQLRLRFQKGDNDDMAADYLKIYSGNAPTASRPQLIITYFP